MVEEGTEDNLNTDIIIGFHNGDLEVYSLNSNTTIAKFNLGSEMVNITSYRNSHVIAYTSTKQFILSKISVSSK
jgi:hypothetical protein